MNTNRIPRMAPSEPGWLYRVYRRAMDALHDKAERVALQNRVIALDELELEVREEIAEIRAVMFTGSALAAKEGALQIKAKGEELDQYRHERLRMAAKLAALE
jgi:hypothetical protein